MYNKRVIEYELEILLECTFILAACRNIHKIYCYKNLCDFKKNVTIQYFKQHQEYHCVSILHCLQVALHIIKQDIFIDFNLFLQETLKYF